MSKFTTLSDKVHELMELTGVPGVALGILHGEEIETAGFGVTNVEHPLPVTAETLFQVGSITKTFTGTLMLRLVELGELDLEAPVRHYLPDFRTLAEEVAPEVTLRHLLIHMVGWEGDLFIDTGAGPEALPLYVAGIARQAQLAPFDTVWSYNNASFGIAGYITEQVTGQSFEAVMEELLFQPLGLAQTYLNPVDVMTHRFVAGHEIKDGEAQVARPWPLPRALWPAGGIISTVGDLLQYAQFQMGEGISTSGQQLLSPQLLRFMHTQQVAIGGNHDAMALTWFIGHAGGTRYLSHAGATLGQMALLLFVPDHNFAVTLLTNGDRGRRVNREISRAALKEYLGLEQVDPPPVNLPEAHLRAYVGRYTRPFADIELRLEEGRLVLYQTPKGSFPTLDVPIPPPPPPLSLAPCEGDCLIVLDGDSQGVLVEVIRQPDGSIGWLRWGSRVHRREDNYD